MATNVRQVIVRRVDNLGDMVIALPALEALRKQYPQSKLTLMVKDAHRPLCRHLCDGFVAPVTLEDFHRLATDYDLAFNVDYFGPGNHARQVLTLGQVNHVNAHPSKHIKPIAVHLADGVAAYGFDVPRGRTPRFPLSASIKASANAWFQASGFESKRGLWIAVHAGSRLSEKCWPPERYAELCRWLLRAFEARFIFIGTKAERSTIKAIRTTLPVGVSCEAVDEPLDLAAAILARADLAIGNDSGVGHLAASVGVPTVSIFGPSAPALWRPAGRKAIVVFKRIKAKSGFIPPRLSVAEVKQGVLLAINQHLRRSRFPALDEIRLSASITVSRVRAGVILRSGTRGPQCLVQHGWRRVSAILRTVEKTRSWAAVLDRHADASPLLQLLILHRIVLQGRKQKPAQS